MLQRTPWLAGCADDVVQQLAAAGRVIRVPEATVLAVRGQDASHLMVVTEGLVELGISSAAGKRHVVNWLGPGQAFGLIPVLEQGPMIHTATAVRPSRLLLLPRAALHEALQAHPAFAIHVIALISTRARLLYDTLAAQSLLTLPARLVRVLVARMTDPSCHRITATQSDLADLLGVTRQSLNTNLRELERDGVLRLGRGYIDILDPVRLRASADTID